MTMTVEQRIQLMLGEKDMRIAVLITELEQAKEKLAELEAVAHTKPDLHVVQQ